jgi:hypothetical protein
MGRVAGRRGVGRVVGDSDVDSGGQDGRGQAREEGGPDAGGQCRGRAVILGHDMDGVNAAGAVNDACVRDARETLDERLGLARELRAGEGRCARGVHVLSVSGSRFECDEAGGRHDSGAPARAWMALAIWEVNLKVLPATRGVKRRVAAGNLP